MKNISGNIIILHMCKRNHNHMRYGSWDRECDRQNFAHFGPFSALLPPNNPENQNFEKMKKAWRYHHFTQVYHKWQSYDVWFLRYEAWQTEFFGFWAIFCPFAPLTQKIKILKKWKKTPGDIIILHKRTKNHDHMLYCSWDMAHDGCNCYFSFWAIFSPFTPLTTWKIKIFKKWKKHLEISSFYIGVTKIIIRWCLVPEIWCATDGRTDGQTDGWEDGRTEKVTYRGGCPT